MISISELAVFVDLAYYYYERLTLTTVLEQEYTSPSFWL
jgi:hypothetical protein